MDEFKPEDVKEKLGRLTARQRQILGLICDGFSHGQIAKTTGLKKNGVKGHVYNIYVKLGLSFYEDDELRRKVVREVFCPGLRSKLLPPPSEEDVERGGLIPIPNAREIAAMVEDDDPGKGQDNETEEPPTIILDPPWEAPYPSPIKALPPPRRFPWRWVIAMLLSIGVTFIATRYWFPQIVEVLTPVTQVVIVTATLDPATSTQTPTTPSPTNTVTVTPAATETSIPTNTPSLTPTPTSTEAVVFFDDFNGSDISPQWEQLSGEYILVGGKLATRDSIWLAISVDVENYQINLDVDTGASGVNNVIAPGFVNTRNFMGFSWEGIQGRWTMTNDQGSETRFGHQYFSEGQTMKLHIEVVDRVVSVTFGGVDFGTLTSPKYNFNRIGLYIGNPWTAIDNFKITALP